MNTQHRYSSSRLRAISYGTRRSELFDWFSTHYEIWRSIGGNAFYVSAKTAMAELLRSGCTASSNHLYLFPRNKESTLIDRESRDRCGTLPHRDILNI
ncbi:MAG: hypothetical protein U5N26_00985 [Candidatus Marinimicrobia bacterium]|nr:hypothetical protein [Candidatus Neomarinimicrobiota bacterium]